MDEGVERITDEKRHVDVDGLLQKTIRLEREAARWKREETALRDMERRYLALLENPLAILLVIQGGRVKYMNSRGESFFGFSLRERPQFFLTDFVAAGFGAELEELLSPGEEAPLWGGRLIFSVDTPDGKRKQMDFAVTPLEYQGQPALLGIGYELPGTGAGTDEPLSSPRGNSAGDILAARKDLFLCELGADFVPSFVSEGFRNAAGDIWNLSVEDQTPLNAGLCQGERQDRLRSALERALSGDEVLLEEETGDSRHFRIALSPGYDGEGRIRGTGLVLTEITEQKRLERRCSAGEETFSRLFRSLPDMMVICSPEEGRIEDCTETFLAAVGLTRDQASGKTLEETGFYADPSRGTALLQELAAAGKVRNFEAKGNIGGGTSIPCLLSGDRADVEGTSLLLISIRDNSAQKKAEEQMKKASSTDMLTGVPNRQGFERILATEMERAVRYRGNLSVILMNLDGFKDVNDNLGHDTGDRILRDFCSAVKGRIRSSDFLGRWGGDEFVILTPMSGPLAFQVAEKIRDMVCHYQFLQDRPLTASFGVAEFRSFMDLKDFIKRADDALREAKKAGGNKALLSPITQ